MTKVAIIRCEKNMDRCPLTNCFRCLTEKKEGFSMYEDCILTGVFACHCPGDIATNLSKILKAKGAEAIHFCTCTFSKKTDKGWVMKDGGLCDNIDQIIEKVNKETDIPCIKGTAHLPSNYSVKTWS
ncbi:MAG: CGGC domain-containing protein [Deltaproteobacteria bacterium]|nr:CGGC domain-containing protein [Deltaproteobacteria bacterium]MBW1861381.1 CGGC domain-containing protein [Deltaproteobacteria bacterium]